MRGIFLSLMALALSTSLAVAQASDDDDDDTMPPDQREESREDSGGWFKFELPGLDEMKQDIAIVSQPVHIIGPEDGDDSKTERLQSCLSYWQHRRHRSNMADWNEALYSVRVWRCMYRAKWTLWMVRCPAAEPLITKSPGGPNARERGRQAMRDMKRAYCYARFS
jgi:hypothetical protein